MDFLLNIFVIHVRNGFIEFRILAMREAQNRPLLYFLFDISTPPCEKANGKLLSNH